MSESDPPAFRMLGEDGEPGPAPDEPPVPASLGRRAKFAIALVTVALVVGGAAVQVHRSRTSDHGTAAAVPTAAASPVQAEQFGLDNCGNAVPQPVIDRSIAATKTGTHVFIGGNSLTVADLDNGTFSPVPQVELPAGSSFVDGTVFRSSPYLEIADCNSGARVVQIGTAGQQRTVLTDPVGPTLLSDGLGGVWAARFAGGGTTIGEAKLQVIMHRLDQPQEIALRALMYPLALYRRVAYVRLETPGAPDRLLAFDLTTHQTVRDLGPVYSGGVAAGHVAWLPEACTAGTGCQLLVLDPTTGITSDHRLTVPVDFTLDNVVLSDNGRLLATQVVRGPANSGKQAVSDVVVVDLDNGSVSTVPHLSVPPGARIAYTFSSDSVRLVLAVGTGSFTDFYTWAPGQSAPMLSPFRLPGPPPTYLEPAR